CNSMRLLLIHPEAKYFAGAEAMLLYFLEGLMSARSDVAIAVAKEGTFASRIPNHVEKIQIHDNGVFSVICLRSQIADLVRQHRTTTVFRVGFLGAFSERKGLQLLFAIVSELSNRTSRPWELYLAGEAQEVAGRNLVEQIHQRFSKESWWSKVHWQGWVTEP